MKYVCVLPWIVKDIRDGCVVSCKLDLFEVDNSAVNLGIMRANNLAIDELRRTDADWLILLSAAVRFGEPGGLDFTARWSAARTTRSSTSRGCSAGT